MSENLIFLLLFTLAFAFNITKTYFILFVASAINYCLVPYYSDFSSVPESGIDLIALVAIYYLGDVHKRIQVGLLCCALFNHVLYEWDNAFGTYFVIGEEEAIRYLFIVWLVTIGQLLGAGYGVLERIQAAINHRSLARHRH